MHQKVLASCQFANIILNSDPAKVVMTPLQAANAPAPVVLSQQVVDQVLTKIKQCLSSGRVEIACYGWEAGILTPCKNRLTQLLQHLSRV